MGSEQKATSICHNCGRPAACVGAYEGQAIAMPSCDDCCGHGNEDGHCEPIEDAGACSTASGGVAEALDQLAESIDLCASPMTAPGAVACARAALERLRSVLGGNNHSSRRQPQTFETIEEAVIALARAGAELSALVGEVVPYCNDTEGRGLTDAADNLCAEFNGIAADVGGEVSRG